MAAEYWLQRSKGKAEKQLSYHNNSHEREREVNVAAEGEEHSRWEGVQVKELREKREGEDNFW